MDDQALNLRGMGIVAGAPERAAVNDSEEAYRYAWRPAGSSKLAAGLRVAGAGSRHRNGPSELALSGYLFDEE